MIKNNQKYHIITIGCQMNKSDSERIAGYLDDYGFKESLNRKKSDLVVINTCGVRQSAEDSVYGLIPKIKKENPNIKIVLTGCLSKREDVQKRLKDTVDIWMPIVDLPDLKNKIDFSFKNEKKMRGCKNYLDIQPNYCSKFSAFVPIGNGCNNFCTYCVVPYARGREVYRASQDILNEVKNLTKKGYKEIVLIAQNVNSYKYDANFKVLSKQKQIKKKSSDKNIINFFNLLQMVNDIEGNFWIRFSTSHPKDMSDDLIKTIAKCDKVCKHIHLPVQSGDNKILKAMNRKYTIEHYRELINKIKKAMPGVAITTDIIVGFPGETERQFQNTVKLFKEVKFDMAYISQYSTREGTIAKKLNDNVSREEKKIREKKLMEILRKTALKNNKKYIGKVAKVLIEGKNKKGEWYGKTETCKNVKICDKNKKCKRGKFIKVKIEKVQDFGLRGKINDLD